jgi:hypothetical protein
MGGRAAGGQGLKFEQWQDAGVLGLTNFGVVDLYSDVPAPQNVDTYVAFVSDGTNNTDLYVNGVIRYTFSGTPLTLAGMQGLAGVLETTGAYSDVLDGNILSFASYDSALSQAEITMHATAFALVPEPGSVGLLAAAAVSLLARRRRAVLGALQGRVVEERVDANGLRGAARATGPAGGGGHWVCRGDVRGQPAAPHHNDLRARRPAVRRGAVGHPPRRQGRAGVADAFPLPHRYLDGRRARPAGRRV